MSLLPTPTVSEATGPGHTARGGMNLRHTVSLLPTPRDSENENRQTRRTPSQEAGKHGLSLAAEVASLLPTPRATDGTKDGSNQRGSRGDLTLPSAAARIGARTARPSTAGKRSSAGPHPGQLTIPGA
ncbi:hypothetical protein ACFRMQ_08460 [Kitasatospora sp. NPDC056783]|uniref:hypothetical protein n=1 Tax=Kitasatospora sp. NPDC056783 TaxID=3345943 RepID=UPI00367D4A76